MKLFQIIESIIKIFESLSDYMTDEWLVTFSIIFITFTQYMHIIEIQYYYYSVYEV